MTDNNISLKYALEKAKEAADVYLNTEDGGTCNFDCVVIDYKTMNLKKSDVIQIIESAELRSFEWEECLVICGFGKGQGNRRTRMAESACQSLKNDNIKAFMYYQMD